MPKTKDGRQIVYKLYNKVTKKYGATGSRGRTHDNDGSVYTRKPAISWVAIGGERSPHYKDNWEVQTFVLVPIEEI